MAFQRVLLMMQNALKSFESIQSIEVIAWQCGIACHYSVCNETCNNRHAQLPGSPLVLLAASLKPVNTSEYITSLV